MSKQIFYLKDEARCPICQLLEDSENLKVCDECQRVLMPELWEQEYAFYDGDINDFTGRIELGRLY
jgi:hypothetical protein